MNLSTLLFYFFIVLAAGGAFSMVITTDLLRAVLSLLVCLLSTAALFIMMGAEFLAITQILVYAGGVVVLMIFGIMLTQRIKGVALTSLEQYKGASILIGVGFLFLLVMMFQHQQLPAVADTMSIRQMGTSLMTHYALPFEWSGVLLLICLIASAFAATAHQKQ